MVSFVILHYLNLQDSIECIESIKSTLSQPDYNIVVVDNGSPNNSGDKLKERYSGIPYMHFLLLQKNLGFAEGNNKGYQYARNELKSDFIIVINNDTLIQQSSFLKLITEKYYQKSFDILGPDILSLKDGSHQNPRKEILTNEKTIKGFIKRYTLMKILSFINLDLKFLQFKKSIIPTSAVSSGFTEKPDFKIEASDVKLHGSALVFSPSFIQKFNCCFFPGTFMYNEESILNYIVAKEGLKTIYYPDIRILHKEDGATDSYLKSNRRKRTFYYKNFIKSSRVLLKLYKHGFNVQDMQ